MRRSRRSPVAPTRILAAVDALALVTFVLAGIGSHHEVGALDQVARNVIPLEIA